jgi:hypothetical protein
MHLSPTSEEAALEMQYLEDTEPRPKSSEDHSDFGHKEASETRPGKEQGAGENHQRSSIPRAEGGETRRREAELPEKKSSRDTATVTARPRPAPNRTDEKQPERRQLYQKAAATGKGLSRPPPAEEPETSSRSFFSALGVGRTRKSSAEELANQWYEKYQLLQADYAALGAENADRQKLVIHLQRVVNDQRVKSDMMQSEYLKERQQLKAKLDGLTNAHVQSVSSVGTGLEPISDQTFDDRFRALRDSVCIYHSDLFGQLILRVVRR